MFFLSHTTVVQTPSVPKIFFIFFSCMYTFNFVIKIIYNERKTPLTKKICGLLTNKAKNTKYRQK